MRHSPMTCRAPNRPEFSARATLATASSRRTRQRACCCGASRGSTRAIDIRVVGAQRVAIMERLCPRPVAAPAAPPLQRVRVGAFAGDALVGWSHGWREPGGQLYVASSAVLPPYRRQGIYSRLLAAIEEQTLALGCQRVTSHQRADNSAVLIAKLKVGYVICGMEFSSEMGLLAKLARDLDPARHALFAARIAAIQASARGDGRGSEDS